MHANRQAHSTDTSGARLLVWIGADLSPNEAQPQQDLMLQHPEVIAAVLLAALMHAAWNALVKSSEDSVLTQAMMFGTAATICLPLAMLVGPPDRASWGLLAAGIALHNGYFFFLLQAYRVGDLSRVYPLSRGLAPLLVALVSAVAVGETLSTAALAGVALVSLGIASLAIERGGGESGLLAAAFAILTGCFISSYTIIDGLGMRRSGNELSFILWLHALCGWPLVLVALRRRQWRVADLPGRQWLRGVVGGCMALVAYSLILWALARHTMALVVAMRETSVVFAALIGIVWLREPLGRQRLRAALLVLAGVMLMNWPTDRSLQQTDVARQVRWRWAEVAAPRGLRGLGLVDQRVDPIELGKEVID